jgi:hypothetical protein
MQTQPKIRPKYFNQIYYCGIQKLHQKEALSFNFVLNYQSVVNDIKLYL